MLRLVVSCFHRAALLSSLLAIGCIHNFSRPAPTPVELVHPPPAGAPEPCNPSAEAIVPPGQTPAPTTEGELELVDMRGEDRLAIDGSVAFTWSSDGEKLVSASNDGVLLWNAATGTLERRIELPTRIETPGHVVMSPDDQWIAFVAYMIREDQGRIEAPGLFLMRANGQGGVQRFEGTGNQISFSADSRRLAAYTHVWDLATGTHSTVTPPKFDYETKFLPGRERVVVFVKSGTWPKESNVPELRDVATGNVLHRFPALDTTIGASLSADGKRIGLLQKGELSVYSTETFERVAFIPDAGKAQMVHLSDDGRRAVTEVLRCYVALSSEARDAYECPKPELTLWDLDTKKILVQTPQGSGDGWVFTSDGEYLTGPETRLVEHIVRIRDGKELRFGSRIRSISPGSRRVLFEDKLGFEIGSLDGKSPVPVFERAPKILARSADGKWHVNAGSDGRLRLESASSCMKLPMIVPTFGEPRSHFDYFSENEDKLVFSPDSLSLYTITAATSMHARFRSFDTQSGVERWSIRAEGRGPGKAELLPLSNQVLFQGYEHPDLRRFNAVTGVELPKGGMPRLGYIVSPRGEAFDVRSHEGNRAGFIYSPISGRDGKRIAMSSSLGGKCAFSIWDLRNPRSVVDRYPGCLSAFKASSPDDKWIAAGAENGRVMLLAWDKDETRVIEGMHEGKTTAILFTPKGDRLAVADTYGNIVVADPHERKIMGRARLPLDHATHLWISSDSGMLVADTMRGMRVRLRLNTRPAQ